MKQNLEKSIKNRITITEYEYGVIINYPICLTWLCELVKMIDDRSDYDIVDGLISEYYNGMCITSKENSMKWRKELGIE
jgi:hypothetical protein